MRDERERRIVWASRAGVWLLRALGRTWRFRVTHDDSVRQLRATKTPFVFSLWHGQLLPLLYLHRNRGVTLLISEHSDGEIIARIAMSLGYKTVRGSTSRGAARALLGVVRAISDGSELAITPDGPRGPARSYAAGVAVVAQRSHAPVIGAAASARSAWRLNTWDRFLIPRPFATVRVAYSEAVQIESNDAREAVAQIDRLREAMDLAEQRVTG